VQSIKKRSNFGSNGILTNPLCRGISINFAAAKCLSAAQYFLQTFLWFRPLLPPALSGQLLTAWKRYTSLVFVILSRNKKSLFLVSAKKESSSLAGVWWTTILSSTPLWLRGRPRGTCCWSRSGRTGLTGREMKTHRSWRSTFPLLLSRGCSPSSENSCHCRSC